MFDFLVTLFLSASPASPPEKKPYPPKQACLEAVINFSDDEEEEDDEKGRRRKRRKGFLFVNPEKLPKQFATVRYNSKGCRNH